ncbi:MAG: hypothetical protein JJU36_09400 [Phycisphaeraceae bacterium]|nr:hypothetical protein [Phycisphaeraceae bacterium]
MPIYPLPVLEEEANPPKPHEDPIPSSVVVSYGYMKMMADIPYEGDVRPLPGQKLVIRSGRGTELAEMRATTCQKCGRNKIDRKQLSQYIESSGGKHYPFTTQGKALRVATGEDLVEQVKLDDRRAAMRRFARQRIEELRLNMHLVEVEPLLGGERIIFHYTSEQWVDFRELVRLLAAEFQTRIEMHQVSPRDEARITADYERCGQQCCCQTFLKYLRPVSMRSAKVQKATLDPSKISGRCGRLMCCLRYEDANYEELRKNLPHKQTRVMTGAGPGTVIDSQIITQLVMVRLDEDDSQMAFGVEEIEIMTREQMTEYNARRDQRMREDAERREANEARRAARAGRMSPPRPPRARPDTESTPPDEQVPDGQGVPDDERSSETTGLSDSSTTRQAPDADAADDSPGQPGAKRRRRRGGRRRGRSGGQGGEGTDISSDRPAGLEGDAGGPSSNESRNAGGPPRGSASGTAPGGGDEAKGGGRGKRKRRRRRRPGSDRPGDSGSSGGD